MAELTSAGLAIQTQSEILADMETDQRAEISDSLDLSTSSPLGQLNYLHARAQRLQNEALEALYLAMDPDSASGDALLRLCAITGTIREAATPSRVAVVCTFSVAGTYAAGSLAAAPAGRPADRFTNVEDVIVAAPGDVSAVFEAETAGAVQAAADTLAIASPVAGWSGIVSHPDATVGSPLETEAALRRRRTVEVESPGSSSAAGIAADLSREIEAIESVYVIENDTDAVVDTVPAHGIEVIVYGPAVPASEDDDLVAAQIMASKAAGIATGGTTTRTVLDSKGVPHQIKFTRPADVTVPIVIDLLVDAETYEGDAAVPAMIAEVATETLVPGADVSWSAVASWAHRVQGVIRVVSISVGGVSFGVQAITARQIARITESDVTATSTEGSA